MSSTDKECIQLCLNGHPDAYGRLVEQYQAPLMSFLVGRLGNVAQAEEAAQETFVRSFFLLKRLKKPEAFFSWLVGIGIRVAMEHGRVERRQKDAARSLSERPSDSEPSHDEELKQAVAGLSKPYRDVILLRYYGGLSCAEVAERLNIRLGTATKRLSRAYAMLREVLGDVHERKEAER